MTEINLTPQDNLAAILERIKKEAAQEITIRHPDSATSTEPSIIDQSDINRRIITTWATKWGKTITFKPTGDPASIEEVQVNDKIAPQDHEAPAPPQGSPPRITATPPIKIITVIAVLLSILLGGALAFVYYYLPQANITLYVEKKEIGQEEVVRVNPGIDEVRIDSDSEDPELVVPGTEITVQNNASGTFTATGSATEGTKARGTVTIYNKVEAETTIKIGTELATSDGKTFTLEKQVVVPPADESATGIEYGSTPSVEIVATEIGEEYNIPGDTLLDIDKHSAHAITEKDLTGGATREITVVSPEDLQQARSELAAQIFSTNKTALEKKVQDSLELTPENIREEIVDTSYSASAGSEKDNFTTTVTARSSVTAFNRDQIKDLLQNQLKDKVPEGFVLTGEDTSMKIQYLNTESDGNITLIGNIRSTVIPNFDQQEIIRRLTGVKPDEAKLIVHDLENIVGYQIDLWPKMPHFIRTMPHRPERIKIMVEIRTD